MIYKFSNQFSYPKNSLSGIFLNLVLNNSFFIKTKRFLFYPFTRTKLKSDIRDVVYLNWLVPSQNVAHLIPPGVKIREYNGKVLLTVLTYKHGNFRPVFLDEIKVCFGSPLQSNWRLYLNKENQFQPSEPTVLFVKNLMNSMPYTVGSRLFSNILNTHMPASFEHSVSNDIIFTRINPGISNSPDLEVILKPSSGWKMPHDFLSAFRDTDNLITEICDQEYAVSDQHENNRYCVAQINLRFNRAEIKPLEVVRFESKWLKAIIGDSECLAFIIPEVTFLTLMEKTISLKKHELFN